MRTLVITLLALLSATVHAARFEIADGDVDGFFAALDAAETTPETDTIVLAHEGIYEFSFEGRNLRVDTAVIISGNGSTWTGNARDFIIVAPTGELFVNDLNILDMGSISSTQGYHPLLRNRGQTVLDRTTLWDIRSPGLSIVSAPIVNHGDMKILNSTISGNRATGGLALESGALFNDTEGTMLIQNSTIADNIVLGGFHDATYPSPVAGAINNQGTLRIGNTIFSNNVVLGSEVEDFARNCLSTGTIISLGGNIDSDGSCGLHAARDRSGVDPFLGPLEDNGGLTLTHALIEGSPAIDNGRGALQIDQRGQYRVGRRDSGAVEFNGRTGDPISSGMTGTWYVKGQDGHYFVVEVLAGGVVAASWLTYDLSGDQQWVYAVGAVNGSRVRMDAHVSSGMASPGFDPMDREQVAWGALELNFKDCNTAWAQWRTGDSKSVTDEAKLRRLTSVLGAPCPGSSAKGFEPLIPTLPGPDDGGPAQPAQWTGAWHYPAKDGHYFLVERLNQDTALIYWLTYDTSGNPRWVYAVGNIQNDRFTADVFTVEGPRPPEFGSEDLKVTPWGFLEFEVTRCKSARAEWHTSVDGFTPGATSLTRLTEIEGLGCS